MCLKGVQTFALNSYSALEDIAISSLLITFFIIIFFLLLLVTMKEYLFFSPKGVQTFAHDRKRYFFFTGCIT